MQKVYITVKRICACKLSSSWAICQTSIQFAVYIRIRIVAGKSFLVSRVQLAGRLIGLCLLFPCFYIIRLPIRFFVNSTVYVSLHHERNVVLAFSFPSVGRVINDQAFFGCLYILYFIVGGEYDI